MKKFKGLMISTAVLLCTAAAGAVEANAGIGIWGNSYGTFCSGDINLDGDCTVADAVLMQKYLLGSFSKDEKFVAANIDVMSTADLNLDGKIDVFDFIIMRDCLINPDNQNEISWCVDSFGTAKKEACETVGKEYIFTSAEQTDEYFRNFAYEDCSCIGKYTDDFFQDNVLLMKPVFEDSVNNFYSINKIFYDGDKMNIDYTCNYYGEISEESGAPILLLVTVPKSCYHAEEISWNSKETDWKPLLDFIKKSNITREEFLDLLLSKEEFTWSDFEQYRSVDVGSGIYILKYEIEFEDSEDNLFFYISGGSMDEKPDRIYIEKPDGETIDIYELREYLLDFFGRNITREEFLDLLLSKEEFTWYDFEQYRSVDVGSGTYILKYEIEFEDGEDNVFIYVCGESMDEKPENIYLERCSDGETVDIYEFRRELLYLIDGFKAPENNETNRNNVQKIADYAFSGLKDGTFDLQTSLDYDDIADNSELADCWKESHCLYFDFIDEHTVKVVLNGGGFFEVYGYLVTDGTVEYETGWFDNINVGYDGGGINIEERNGNLYFFNAGL